MDDINNIIARNISELRQKNKLTQIELAEKLNYSDKAVSKWERGESIPNIAVLVSIANLFNVSLDYLVEEEHDKTVTAEKTPEKDHSKRNYGFITGMCVLLVWAIATLSFVAITLAAPDCSGQWLAFIYAVPVSLIVWLVFNSLWLNKRINYLIISALMWSVLASLHITALVFGKNIWLIYLIGIPCQIIILFWSGLRFKKKDKRK